MDISLVIRQRLKDLNLEQKDLAAAASVTESYISQLLARKKAPPAPGRTDIYEKIGVFLRLPAGELANLAEAQRKEELRKKVADPPQPLFKECRDLLLRKCAPESRGEIQRIFEKEPFGELERLVTQKLLDAAQALATQEWGDTDVFHVSVENRVAFLDPIIDSWDIDLKTFSLECVLDRGRKRYEFVEQAAAPPLAAEPGLEQFLNTPSLCGDATAEEIAFLKALKVRGRQPTPLYYYRELQNLRDPLHFQPVTHP